MTDHRKGRSFRSGNERIEQLAANPAIAEQVKQVRAATAHADRVYVQTLADIRKAGRLTQTDVARELGVEQAAVSKIERRHDLLLSTLRDYLAAAGAQHPRIVVEKDGMEVSLDLDSFDTNV
ncbi:helix-turn-helix domain-containing protein [Gordonia amarae]|uniref:HTH cro/C1-type domain-containing protein n=2 Tax=Gordonia amarae TaxID=36821 RepID=G7GWJ5_9ACTN|nr:XRE family transcriptional regulator [Gordonia amarae]MCS3877292.1 DNA-binding XRE family transcriptional regulator [Gordonia amarae]QHN16061.1 helix-turn-helix domain-containing protein [Gordonia amarae]QHN20629.1 helix-turn-helix domain-containing protein [Gordonia amarae]QHN29481.1 helix-turn-helix domain-containing protein [Gordonia amarae]QHN38257.1 helix-turn-helix domain-containing protein [Gordonia amarae]